MIAVAPAGTIRADTFVRPISQTTNVAGTLSVGQSFDVTINGNGMANLSLIATGAVVPVSTATSGYTSNNTYTNNIGRFSETSGQVDMNGQGNSFTPAGVSIVFNLGADYMLTGMWLWNYRESGPDVRNRGLDSVTVEFSTDNLNWSDSQVLTPSRAENSFGYAQSLAFTDTSTDLYRYVRFSSMSNFGTAINNNFLGFNEVRFTAAVPEPATYGLLGAGALAAAAFVRRRKR